MDFTFRKLPQEVAEQLRRCAISSVKPYALMVAPAYVYLKQNHKFVSVKAPLDFFSPEELTRMAPYENFFFPECVDASLEFRGAGTRVRALLSIPAGDAPTPSSFELSDAILRIVGPLWGGTVVLEAFFATVFANELCGLLSGQWMQNARDQAVETFERALLHSGLVVFLALHLGYCDLAFLKRLRIAVLTRHFGAPGVVPGGRGIEMLVEWAELRVRAGIAGITPFDLAEKQDRLALQLTSRLTRVQSELLRGDIASATISGPGGFAHVG